MKKLTCSYGKTFLFSMTENNGQPIMVVDANIKNYVVHIGPDAGTYDFPKTIVLNDKLYLDKKLTDELLEVLDVFIETTYIQSDDAETNARGFKNLSPTDIYGNRIWIQESSSVIPAIWFGIKLDEKSALFWENNELKSFKYHYNINNRHHYMNKIILPDMLHLKIPQAKRMRKMIKKLWEIS